LRLSLQEVGSLYVRRQQLRHLPEHFGVAATGRFQKRHAFGCGTRQRLIEKPTHLLMSFR
jgi:hypothetical protein